MKRDLTRSKATGRKRRARLNVNIGRARYMSRKEPSKSTWSAVKSAISDFDREALVALIQDLYALSPGNKRFIDARFGLGQDPAARYKKVIAECMCPDASRPLQISRAKKAIREYGKASGDVRGEVDLMIHFVECGNRFTLEYGDIDGKFYDSLLSMYARAVDAVMRLPNSGRESFRKRLRELTESSNGIGWGYHDGLCDAYYSAFPEAAA